MSCSKPLSGSLTVPLTNGLQATVTSLAPYLIFDRIEVQCGLSGHQIGFHWSGWSSFTHQWTAGYCNPDSLILCFRIALTVLWCHKVFTASWTHLNASLQWSGGTSRSSLKVMSLNCDYKFYKHVKAFLQFRIITVIITWHERTCSPSSNPN